MEEELGRHIRRFGEWQSRNLNLSPMKTISSYEDYLKEGETNWRYDIIDGVRVDRANPTPYHQHIVQRVTRFLEDYEAVDLGLTFAASCDIFAVR